MKFTKKHEKQMREFMDAMDADGCLPVDRWVTGTFKSRQSYRALPPFTARYDRDAMPKHPQAGTPEAAAAAFFEANPRRRYVLAMDKEAAFGFLFGCAWGKEF